MEEEHSDQENTIPPTMSEVTQAIMKYANKKSPAADSIPAELFKYGREEIANHTN